jgi:hypothetical protein
VSASPRKGLNIVMEQTNTARAHHDLNGVEVLEIRGWPGHHQVVAKTDDNSWVTIEAPQRIPEEYWTFGSTRNGVLRCHSDLIGSPTLVALGTDQTLTVYLPADKVDKVDVRLV